MNDQVNKLNPAFLSFRNALATSMEQTRNEAIALSLAHLSEYLEHEVIGVACLGSILSRPDRAVNIAEVSKKIRRASVQSAFLQGIHAVETCIMTASYAQAAALVRQEIEAVEVLRGIRQERQKDGETPRLKALKHLGRSYSQLTSLAHLTGHDLLSNVVSRKVVDVDHTFNDAFAAHLFSLHLVTLIGVALDMADLRPFSNQDAVSPEEQSAIATVCAWLDSTGYLTPNITETSY